MYNHSHRQLNGYGEQDIRPKNETNGSPCSVEQGESPHFAEVRHSHRQHHVLPCHESASHSANYAADGSMTHSPDSVRLAFATQSND